MTLTQTDGIIMDNKPELPLPACWAEEWHLMTDAQLEELWDKRFNTGEENGN